MHDWQIPLTVIGILMTPMAILVGTVFLWKWRTRRRKRRSPLTTELLRPPAFGLSDKLEDLQSDLTFLILLSLYLPAVVLAMFLAQVAYGTPPGWGTVLLFHGTPTLVALGFVVARVIGLAGRMRTYREGRDGEWATAQLLEPITAGGGRVLHDIQAPGFNIDHVVITPGGVFAIETKHRLKPTTGRALDNSKVSFDGKALRFPDWTDTKTAEQAAAQARWLSERLTKATGLTVKARPIIALPGWYVENTSRGEVWAMNPKNCSFMLNPGRDRAPLDKADIKRIAFQVEQLCRLPALDGSTDAKGTDKR